MYLIGLEPDIPEQVKIAFDDKPVSTVFRTEFIFFNRGRMVIQDADVARKVTVHFDGATILAEPCCRANRPEIEFQPKRLLRKGEHVIELDFRYLAHNDGAVVEVLHTEIKSSTGLPRFSGSFVAGEELVHLEEFNPFRFRDWVAGIMKLETLAPLLLIAGVVAAILGGAITQDELEFIFVPIAFVLFIAAVVLRQYHHSKKFPEWANVIEDQ